MLVAGLVAGLIIAFPGGGRQKGAEVSNIPGDIVKPDKPHAFRSRRDEVLSVARKFVATAVVRHHVERSWNLVAPVLKEGFTKKSWTKGEIPVVPFPYRIYLGKWRVGYSFTNEVELQVALYAPPKTKVRPVVFDLTLNRFNRNGKGRWLVSSFIPTPSPSGDFGSSSQPKPGNPLGLGIQERVPPPKHASRAWLLFPAVIFGIAIAVVVALAIRHWRGARIYRAHVRERQISSSRPS